MQRAAQLDADSDPAPRRHHHGRQRALGGAPRARRASRATATGLEAVRDGRARARTSSASQLPDALRVLDSRTGTGRKREVDELMRLLEHYLEARARRGDAQRHPGARDRAARPAARRACADASTSAVARTREQPRDDSSSSRSPTAAARRSSTPRARSLRDAEPGKLDPERIDEKTFAAYLYDARAPRSRPADPHRRRAARLELPALADRLHRALTHRRDVARLPQAATWSTRCSTTRRASAASA